MGSSPLNWTNRTGVDVTVIAYHGLGFSQIKLNGTVLAASYTGLFTLPLQPGDWVTLSWTSGTPAAYWKPL